MYASTRAGNLHLPYLLGACLSTCRGASHPLIPIHTRAHTHSYIHTRAHTLIHTHSRTHTHTHTLAHTHSHTHRRQALCDSPATFAAFEAFVANAVRAHTHTLSLTYTLTLTHTQRHTHTHTHAHTHQKKTRKTAPFLPYLRPLLQMQTVHSAQPVPVAAARA